ncbi:MAG: hypothetical protein H7Y30_00750 [Pyrinomonadaceae bacterium]|nr:hypothetical protein [Pyrinomonadaceae bacterium]
MKKVIIILVIVVGIAVGIVALSARRNDSTKHEHESNMDKVSVPPQTARVPAHFEDAKSALPLKATLDPMQFFGKTRQAYQVAREIPETLAQLPCYCYCDQGFGHKSLHSCYEDDHSAHCATCVDEALMAYRLQKEEKLSPPQIREKIIAEFSR